jgi:hypothetical protein
MTTYKLTESINLCRENYDNNHKRAMELEETIKRHQGLLNDVRGNCERLAKSEDQLLALQTEINATLLDLKSQIDRLSKMGSTEDFIALQQTVSNLFTLEGQEPLELPTTRAMLFTNLPETVVKLDGYHAEQYLKEIAMLGNNFTACVWDIKADQYLAVLTPKTGSNVPLHKIDLFVKAYCDERGIRYAGLGASVELAQRPD